ncbi:MAG: S-layer homology domain-containing protein [Armatimonadetes bacterium]|nr:S-layer homology domain-containing protein [Armatimonadota bacterium]
MVVRAVLCALALMGLFAAPARAHIAYYLSSFGEGIPFVKWWVLSPDRETLTLSDGGVVRDYELDGISLARRFSRDLPRGELLAAEAAPSGDLYFLMLGEFDEPVNELLPVIVRWSAEGAPLGGAGAIGDGPGEFQDPNDLAIAPDGSVIVADLGNSRFQRFSPDLEFIGAWPASASLLARGFVGPTHVAVDQESRIWACYLPDSVSSVDYPIEVVVYDLDGNELDSFGTTVEISHAPAHWGKVLLSVGVDASERIHFFCATGWSERVIASCDADGVPLAQFPVSGYGGSASFTADGRAVVKSHDVGFEIFSAEGVSLHRWANAEWAFENNLLSGPQDIEFDSQGRLFVSGGESPTVDQRDYAYIHRYGLDGSLEEVIVSTLENAGVASCYFALDPEGIPVPSWCPAVTDSQGNSYYLFGVTSPIIHKISPTGEVIAEWDFGYVTAMNIGPDELLYTLCRNRVEVRDLEGNLLHSFEVYRGACIAADADGRVWVGRSLYTADGEYLGNTSWASGEEFYPSAVAVREDGLVAFACEQENRVHLYRLDPPLFSDVAGTHWAFWPVEACADAGLVAGYPDGLYRPSAPVDRVQMAVYIARALAGGDEKVPECTTGPTFHDVTRWHWAFDYVEYAVTAGIVTGYEDGLYHPDWAVNRGQMAVYVARAMVAPSTAVLADYTPADPENFPDVPSDHWAYKYVEYCVEQGVVTGFPEGDYKPANVVTRDQMAVYIQRAFSLPM